MKDSQATVDPHTEIQIMELRCEYLKNPMGLGVAQPRFFWKMASEELNQKQTAYQILTASSLEMLNENGSDFWNTGKVCSDQSIHVEYAGKVLKARDACWWKVRVWDREGRPSVWSEPAYFEMGLLSPDDWKADWIKTDLNFDTYSYPSPILRREFTLAKKIQKARAYVTALGLYEMQINGKRVDDRLFTPGFTSYDKRNQYQVYDVTSLLNTGKNAIGLILGNGWYRNYRHASLEGPDPIESTRQDLLVIAQVEVTCADGAQEFINTDSDWKSSTGPILMTSIYDGETYDARLEKSGWSAAGYDDSHWHGVEVVNRRKETIAPTIGPAARRIEEIVPVNIIHTKNGDTLFDMGQNIVGWCRLNANCPEGTTIILRHGEVLDKDGNLYTESLRSAKQTITYTCKGGGQDEIYEPRFSFQGFRYVEISGYPGKITNALLTGIVIHSDMERTGQFSCDNDLVNRLYQSIVRVQKGNSLDIPTDCPQRDERMGWLGDAQLFAPTGCTNMLAAGFYTKWLKDIAAEQEPSGLVNFMAPKKFDLDGVYGYADAAVTVPWLLYTRYGDSRILMEQYESMKAWVEFQFDKTDDLRRLKWDGLGDWLAYGGNYCMHYLTGQPTETDLLGTVYFYRATDLLQKTAVVLDKQEDAVRYQSLAERIKKAFEQEFITPKGRLLSHTQTAYALSISFGLLSEDTAKIMAGRLADNVNDFKHITTGLLGTAEICHALTDSGYNDEAYKLLRRRDYPSWLYMMDKGGTSIWERWDSLRPDGTFQRPQMNSFNHPALGSVGDWLYRKVGGIDCGTDAPGYKCIVIKPYPGMAMNRACDSYESSYGRGELANMELSAPLTAVIASYESLYGTIHSEWKIEDKKFQLKVQIPPNTRASIYIPSTGSEILMDGKMMTTAKEDGLNDLGYHFLVFETGSGSFQFESEFDQTIRNREHTPTTQG